MCGHKHLALLHGNVAEAVDELQALGEKVLSFKRVDLEGVGEFVAAFIGDNTGGLIEMPRTTAPSRFPGARPDSKQGPLRITRLHHVAICVPDREEAVRWYSDILRFFCGDLLRSRGHRSQVGNDAGSGVLDGDTLHGRREAGSH